MTQKEFIPYEQALELKQLGFDEPCLAFYGGKEEDQKIYFNTIRNASGDYLPYQTSQDRLSWFGAPLFQQAFRFFREKYNLYMAMLPYKNRFEISIRSGHYLIDIGSYTTYEEAELACLKKLIEIVKHKQ